MASLPQPTPHRVCLSPTIVELMEQCQNQAATMRGQLSTSLSATYQLHTFDYTLAEEVMAGIEREREEKEARVQQELLDLVQRKRMEKQDSVSRTSSSPEACASNASEKGREAASDVMDILGFANASGSSPQDARTKEDNIPNLFDLEISSASGDDGPTSGVDVRTSVSVASADSGYGSSGARSSNSYGHVRRSTTSDVRSRGSSLSSSSANAGVPIPASAAQAMSRSEGDRMSSTNQFGYGSSTCRAGSVRTSQAASTCRTTGDHGTWVVCGQDNADELERAIQTVLPLVPYENREVFRSLCTMGFSPTFVRVGLEMYPKGTPEDEALLDFLSTCNQLRDLGYGDEDVCQSMLLNNNDREKALNMLLAN